jgi:hypothetical protein
MQSNTKCFLPVRHGEGSVQGNGLTAAIARIICSNLLLFGIALVFSMTFSSETRAADDQMDIESYENLDVRWQPWIGTWRPVSNTINASESDVTENYLLTISPNKNGKSITMKGYRGETVLSEERIIADGLRHPITDERCIVWYLYAWSENGKRLLFNSESSCPGELPHLISGLSFIDATGDWVDIQLLQSGEEKAVATRRYRNADDNSVSLGRVNANSALFTRLSTGTNFSIDEIIELSSKVEPEILEAALLEMRKPFPINKKELIRLADAKVPSQIVDLMVALSFPDRFTVERSTISPVQSPQPQQSYPYPPSYNDYWYSGYPLFPWYWGASIYSPYNYWYSGWDVWAGWYYPYWGYPVYIDGDYETDSGRLVAGSGYNMVSPGNSGSAPRYARPRIVPEGQGAVSRPASSSYSGGSSSSYSSRSSISSGSYPCASPGGYSSGNCY